MPPQKTVQPRKERKKKEVNNQFGVDTNRSEWIWAKVLELNLKTFKVPNTSPSVAGS